MGLFDFAKNANTAAPKVDNNMMTDMFKQKLDEYGLVINGAQVEYNNGVVVINGEAANQATKEKVVVAIGNLNGVSQVDDRMTVARTAAEIEADKKEAEGQFYTVVSGDSLSKISKHFYGDAMKYNEIFEANKPITRKTPSIAKVMSMVCVQYRRRLIREAGEKNLISPTA